MGCDMDFKFSLGQLVRYDNDSIAEIFERRIVETRNSVEREYRVHWTGRDAEWRNERGLMSLAEMAETVKGRNILRYFRGQRMQEHSRLGDHISQMNEALDSSPEHHNGE